jgi:dihydrofolate reductase
MSKVFVRGISISVDGFIAGPNQSLEQPMGVGGMALHDWAFATKTFRAMHGADGGSTGIDERFAARGFEQMGAWILGRNMFGPIRGSWGDESWKGWWGTNPPYHVPTFVLTHHARAPLVMEGGTTFHFVTGGIHEALARAKEAAAGKNIRIGGGASTVRQYLEAGLVDEVHLACAPVVLGKGENIFHGLDWAALGFRVTERVPGEIATHVVLTKG